MRRFVFVMGRLQKSHVAFSFSHAAFPYSSWSTSIIGLFYFLLLKGAKATAEDYCYNTKRFYE